MSQKQIDILQRALVREKASRRQAEKILESKSAELYGLAEQLKESKMELEIILDKKTSQLRGVFENINDAYLVMNLQGDVLKMNNIAIDLFGYNIDKEKLNVLRLIYNEDAEYAFKSFNQLIEKGFFTDYAARVNTKFKGIRWIHINASIIYDRRKKPIAAQGIIRDITETKYNNKLIVEQQTQLDAIVQNSPIGIVLIQHGNILRTNEAIQVTLGYSEEELSKLTIKDISFADDFQSFEDYIKKMESGELDNFVIEKRYKKKNGSILWAKTKVNAVPDSSGNIKYGVALIEDITLGRKQSIIIETINNIAKAILGKIDIYEIAWEITNNIAKYLDTDDCIIYLVNHKSETLEQIAAFGKKVKQKKLISNILTIPLGKGIVGTVANSGMSEIVNDTSKDKRYIVDDERRFSEITVPIISEGKVIGIIDSEHITKNYFTKEHLGTLKNIASLVSLQLKSAINLRERKKAEAKNIILLSELEKSNDELHEYAHIVSHDLKSPLRSINALMSWIKEDNMGNFDAASLQNFNLIELTLEKMERLISDILLYSKIGSDTNENQEVDLNLIILDIKQILFIPDNITVVVKNKLPIILGEWSTFHQLFQNLISNAIKFNDKENGLIEIDIIEQKSFYQFSIKDNGLGIDKKYHVKIFKIFHSLNENKDSSGIGLSIIKKIVDLYHGEIWLESELNKGATFYFTLKK
jgi:PAS domain S-box-containing protein